MVCLKSSTSRIKIKLLNAVIHKSVTNEHYSSTSKVPRRFKNTEKRKNTALVKKKLEARRFAAEAKYQKDYSWKEITRRMIVILITSLNREVQEFKRNG